MIRKIDVIMVFAAIAGAVYTYQIKHEAEVSAKRLNDLRAQISAQDRKIVLLEADWALETNPVRLKKISEQYSQQLGLKRLESSQIIDLSELPGFRKDRDTDSDETYAGKTGDVVTGGIDALLEKVEGEQ